MGNANSGKKGDQIENGKREREDEERKLVTIPQGIHKYIQTSM